MKLFVLDPTRYKAYVDDGLCPNCGYQKIPGQGEHMTFMTINDLPTWGCRFSATTAAPLRLGMISR